MMLLNAGSGMLIVAGALGVFAQPPNMEGQQEPVEPAKRVLLEKTDGTTHPLSSLIFSEQGVHTTAGDIPFRELVRISVSGRTVRAASSVVALSNGDRIAMQVQAIGDETVFGTGLTDQKLMIPLEFVQAIATNMPETLAARRKRWQAVSTAMSADTIFLTNGDRVSGEVQGLTGQEVAFESASGPVVIPLANVATVRFSSELISPIPKDQALAILQTVADEIITVTSIGRSVDGQSRVQTAWQGDLEIPTEQIVQLQFLHDRLTYLSDLPAQSVKHVPILGQSRQPGQDLTVNGGPMRHEGLTYVKGVGTTSRMEVTWNLDAAYTIFATRYGLDDTAKNGATVVSVRLDGQQVFKSDVLGSPELQSLPTLNVAGARELTLEVDYGPRGDLQDIVNWVGAVLVKRVPN